MFKAIKYVVSENIANIYRIFCIVRYELLADMRDSRLGLFWNFAGPAIQIATYWFAFGFVFNRDEVNGIDFLSWLIGGMIVWFFVSACITHGCNAIFNKTRIIKKMKFPVSILPTTVVFQQAFNHVCILAIAIILFIFMGHYPSLYWFEIIYYFICAILFGISLSLITSVLTMLARDTKKLITACMRLLLYVTPILWDIERLPAKMQKVMKFNPIYYIVNGYRDCFFFHEGILCYSDQMIIFWIWIIVLFCVGSVLMYKFRTKFIDLI